MSALRIIALSGWLLLGIARFSQSAAAADPVKFTPPPDGRPTRRPNVRCCYRSSGSGLLPKNKVGLTAQDRPSLYIHVKHRFDRPIEAVLYVTDTDEVDGHESRIQLPASEGIVEVSLPDTLSALETDQSYRWTLYLMPNGTMRPDAPYIRGFITRVAPVFTPSQLNELSVSERLAAYDEAGLWYDQLSTLASMQAQAPHDPYWNEAWRDLLTQAGLESLVEQPLLF